jgi:hypothetical protein
MATISTSNNTAAHRYEIASDGQLAGFAEYNVLTDALLFTHTEILPAFEGQGLGSRLARHALDDVRAQGKHAIPVCQFIAAFIRKHPEYQDLVREDMRRAFKI